jgi:hypothetical protein
MACGHKKKNHGYPLGMPATAISLRRTNMVQEDANSLVSIVHPICCGLDVHKETLVACLLVTGADGRIQS